MTSALRVATATGGGPTPDEPAGLRAALSGLGRRLRSRRALSRLNHVLIPEKKPDRDKVRRSLAGRLLLPLVVVFGGLTREGRSVLLLSFLVGLAGLDVGQSQVYLLFSMLAGVLAASLLARPFFRVQGVAISVEAPVRVVAGERQRFVVRLDNRGHAPQLSLRVSGPFLPWDGRWARHPEGVARLAPRERAAVVAEARFVARGEHHLDAFTVSALVPFGLASGPGRASEGVRFLVVPRAAEVVSIALTHRLPSLRGAHVASMQRGESEIATVRPYRPGDPLKHLHPRTWARTGVPHVKQWIDERSDRVGIAVLTDGDEATEPAKEGALSLAAGVAARLSSERVPLHALIVDERVARIAPRSGAAALDAVLDRLGAHVLTDRATSAEAVVEEHAPALSALVLVTADAAPRRRALVERLVRRGLPVRWAVVVDRPEPAGGAKGLEAPVLVELERVESGEAIAL